MLNQHSVRYHLALCKGPILDLYWSCTIFINDLCKVITNSKGSVFADDFKFVGDASSSASRDLKQQDINAVVDWSIVNKLPYSLGQCAVLGSSQWCK